MHQKVELECSTGACALFCSQSMATIHIEMLSKMKKAIFHCADFTQYGIFWKTEKSQIIIVIHSKLSRMLTVADQVSGYQGTSLGNGLLGLLGSTQ